VLSDLTLYNFRRSFSFGQQEVSGFPENLTKEQNGWIEGILKIEKEE